jgi:hypothetical protein
MTEATMISSESLIAASKVKDTNVYNLSGEKLGSVEDIMIDKSTGRAIYALMSFGGFLGIEEKHHPLPWSTLNYDTEKSGYLVNLDKKMLADAPSYDRNAPFNWTPEYASQVDGYYKTPSKKQDI